MGFVNGNFVPDDLMNLRGDALETAMGERGLGRMRNPLRAGGDTLSDIGGQSDADQLDAASNRRVDTISEGRNLPEGSEAVNPYFDRAKALAPGVVTGGVNAFGTRGVGTTPTEGARVDSSTDSSTTPVSVGAQEQEDARIIRLRKKREERLAKAVEQEAADAATPAASMSLKASTSGADHTISASVGNLAKGGTATPDDIGNGINFLAMPRRGTRPANKEGRDDAAERSALARTIVPRLGKMGESQLRQTLDEIYIRKSTGGGREAADAVIESIVDANNFIRESTRVITLEVRGKRFETREDYEKFIRESLTKQGESNFSEMVVTEFTANPPEEVLQNEKWAAAAARDTKKRTALAAQEASSGWRASLVEDGRTADEADDILKQAQDDPNGTWGRAFDNYKSTLTPAGKARSAQENRQAKKDAEEGRGNVADPAFAKLVVAAGARSQNEMDQAAEALDTKLPQKGGTFSMSNEERTHELGQVTAAIRNGASLTEAVDEALADGVRQGQIVPGDSTETIKAQLKIAYGKELSKSVNTDTAKAALKVNKIKLDENTEFFKNLEPHNEARSLGLVREAIDGRAEPSDDLLTETEATNKAIEAVLDEMALEAIDVESDDYLENVEELENFSGTRSKQPRFGPLYDAVSKRLNEIIAADDKRAEALEVKRIALEEEYGMLEEKAAAKFAGAPPDVLANTVRTYVNTGVPATNEDDARLYKELEAKAAAGDAEAKQLIESGLTREYGGIYTDIRGDLSALGIYNAIGTSYIFPDSASAQQQLLEYEGRRTSKTTEAGNPNAMYYALNPRGQTDGVSNDELYKQALFGDADEPRVKYEQLSELWMAPVMKEVVRGGEKVTEEAQLTMSDLRDKQSIEKFFLEQGGYDRKKLEIIRPATIALYNQRGNKLVRDAMSVGTTEGREAALRIAVAQEINGAYKLYERGYDKAMDALGATSAGAELIPFLGTIEKQIITARDEGRDGDVDALGEQVQKAMSEWNDGVSRVDGIFEAFQTGDSEDFAKEEAAFVSALNAADADIPIKVKTESDPYAGIAFRDEARNAIETGTGLPGVGYRYPVMDGGNVLGYVTMKTRANIERDAEKEAAAQMASTVLGFTAGALQRLWGATEGDDLEILKEQAVASGNITSERYDTMFAAIMGKEYDAGLEQEVDSAALGVQRIRTENRGVTAGDRIKKKSVELGL